GAVSLSVLEYHRTTNSDGTLRREGTVSIELADESLLRTQAYIDGQWVDSDSGRTYEVTNPANGKVIANVAECGAAETRRAIEAAERAMGDWRRRSVKQRAAIMRKWFDLMMEHQED